MLFLVCYDIAHPRRLRKVARVMQGFGTRVQKSVFECDLDEAALARLLGQVRAVLDEQHDGVLLYRLCRSCVRERQSYGITPPSETPEVFIL